jgi:serine/threonine protein kinase
MVVVTTTSNTVINNSNNKDTSNLRVSFRDDVIFEVPKDYGDTARSAVSTQSHSSSIGDSNSTESSRHNYSKLRSSLTRDQTNRDPLFFYQVTRNLGEGSMGSVQLVKKRADKVGGSARRDLQEAVRRQKRERECLNIPVIGNLFQFCIDGDLKVDANSSSRHSVISAISNSSNIGKEDRTVSTQRSFEDSLLSSSSGGSENEIIYAMKSIHLSMVTQQDIVDELRNEIKILRDLDHPNIVRPIETFEYRGKISIVMELCSGGDLYSRDPYSEPEAARIVTSILSAIAYMHSKGIVHRDLKFENILFASTSPLSEVKLIDFGLSRVYMDTKLTEVSGTVYTMAPEVILGHHTEKADMWSIGRYMCSLFVIFFIHLLSSSLTFGRNMMKIGVIAYMLLGSALPFYGKDRLEVVKKILNNKYGFRAKRFKRVSPEAKQFVKELLVPDPDERKDAQTALRSPWLRLRTPLTTDDGIDALRTEEEELARLSMVKYSTHPKLKKMVRTN